MVVVAVNGIQKSLAEPSTFTVRRKKKKKKVAQGQLCSSGQDGGSKKGGGAHPRGKVLEEDREGLGLDAVVLDDDAAASDHLPRHALLVVLAEADPGG